MLGRLAHQAEVSADPVLAVLLDKLRTYPALAGAGAPAQAIDMVVPFELMAEWGTMASLSMLRNRSSGLPCG